MNYAIIDTETTGTPRDPWARIVEVGAVAFTDGAIEIGTFSSLVCPAILDERAEPALYYNNISFEVVASAPTESAVREKLLDWMTQYAVTRFYAYNQIFDATMLDRSGIFLPWAGCIMQLARRTIGGSGGPSLDKAAMHFHIPTGSRHRALDDARLAAAVLHRIIRTPVGSI